MSTPEENVLAARDAFVVDENDWEEFSLTDVKIYAQGKPRFANLLTANGENPVRVSGVLDEVEEDQEHLCEWTSHQAVLPSDLWLTCDVY
jgi:hypothetical protein